MASRVDVKTPEGRKVIEQITSNLDRLQSLAIAGKREQFNDLADETEEAINNLSGRGSVGKRGDLMEVLRARRTTLEEVLATPKQVKTGRATKATVSYQSVEDADDIIEEGARRVVEGVLTQVKASQIAMDIAMTMVRASARVLNAQGEPDLRSSTEAMRDLHAAMYRRAGDLFRQSGGEMTTETTTALQRLQRAVQNRKPDARVAYLRSLESDPKEAARFKDIPNPDNKPLAEAIADHYGFPLKTRAEIARERRAALGAAPEPTVVEDWAQPVIRPGTPTTHDEEARVSRAVHRLSTVRRMAVRVTNTAKTLPDERKREIAQYLDSLIADLAKLKAEL